MAVGESSACHQGGCNRCVGDLRQSHQLGRGPGGDDPAAGVNHRPLCRHEQINRRPHLEGVTFQIWFVTGEVHLSGGVVPFDVAVENVLGQVD